MRWDHLFFDLDGTLTDPAEGICGCIRYALEKDGRPTGPMEEYFPWIGPPLEFSFREFAGASDEDTPRLVAYYRERFSTIGWAENEVYEGIPALLEELRGRGVRMAIVSNKGDFAVKELAKLYFDGVIPIAVGARDGVPVKPARDLVDLALRELDADLSRAVYIGDSEVDVVTARNADLPCISLSWGFRSVETLREAGADVICDDIGALRRALGL